MVKIPPAQNTRIFRNCFIFAGAQYFDEMKNATKLLWWWRSSFFFRSLFMFSSWSSFSIEMSLWCEEAEHEATTWIYTSLQLPWSVDCAFFIVFVFSSLYSTIEYWSWQQNPANGGRSGAMLQSLCALHFKCLFRPPWKFSFFLPDVPAWVRCDVFYSVCASSIIRLKFLC